MENLYTPTSSRSRGCRRRGPPIPHNGTQFFCFCVRFCQKVPASEVGTAPTRNPGSTVANYVAKPILVLLNCNFCNTLLILTSMEQEVVQWIFQSFWAWWPRRCRAQMERKKSEKRSGSSIGELIWDQKTFISQQRSLLCGHVVDILVEGHP